MAGDQQGPDGGSRRDPTSPEAVARGRVVPAVPLPSQAAPCIIRLPDELWPLLRCQLRVYEDGKSDGEIVIRLPVSLGAVTGNWRLTAEHNARRKKSIDGRKAKV
jgi:hypothetical protein